MTYAQDVTICDECAQDITDDEAPTCATHRLHNSCAPWFGCQECDYIRNEVCS